ncbi:amidase [Streptomyces sp. GS7]|uniref:amidase n=1 Tax=Streptomyces sp. GS7 TaxID=2692234 RepID=UPI0013199B9F|nr:amidase [Streptomyces sp. GS7]QHC23949.1 amidase [Streptomyces sp. GS7]
MTPSDISRAPAHTQLQALAARTVSSRELLDLHLDRIAGSPLNAVIALDPEAARGAAHAADQRRANGRPGGPLDGLPMTVKDSFETRGLRTASGSPDLRDHLPQRDADAVARLRTAGAIIMGKTNLPAYCQDLHTDNALFGATRNPHHPERTAGGSSGGPAAAVAAHLTPLELGSDLAGSLRLPAHYCGVHALRPTHGLIPSRGHIPRPPGWLTSSDLLTPGPLARHPRDLRIALDVLAGPAEADAVAWRLELPAPAHERIADYRIGVWSDDAHCPVDTATRTLVEDLAQRLRGAGARIDTDDRPVDLPGSDTLFQRLLHANAAGTAEDDAFRRDCDEAAQLPPEDASPRAQFLRLRTQRHRDWIRANEDRARMREGWAAYFRRHDALITPAAPTAAIGQGARSLTVDGRERGFFDQTGWLNLAGHMGLPAAVVPLGTDPDGLPLAVQIIGPRLADRTVLDLAERIGGS